jgi:hypothetical protein
LVDPNERKTFADLLVAAFATHLPRQARGPEGAQQPPWVAQIKLRKPGNYDRKPKTPFHSWWKTIPQVFPVLPGNSR